MDSSVQPGTRGRGGVLSGTCRVCDARPPSPVSAHGAPGEAPDLAAGVASGPWRWMEPVDVKRLRPPFPRRFLRVRPGALASLPQATMMRAGTE